jgi:hypothetical protein
MDKGCSLPGNWGLIRARVEISVLSKQLDCLWGYRKFGLTHRVQHIAEINEHHPAITPKAHFEIDLDSVTTFIVSSLVVTLVCGVTVTHIVDECLATPDVRFTRVGWCWHLPAVIGSRDSSTVNTCTCFASIIASSTHIYMGWNSGTVAPVVSQSDNHSPWPLHYAVRGELTCASTSHRPMHCVL